MARAVGGGIVRMGAGGVIRRSINGVGAAQEFFRMKAGFCWQTGAAR
jgi:hypothetical protein